MASDAYKNTTCPGFPEHAALSTVRLLRVPPLGGRNDETQGEYERAPFTTINDGSLLPRHPSHFSRSPCVCSS